MSQVKKNHVIAIFTDSVYRKFRYQADKHINPIGYIKILYISEETCVAR